MSAAERGGWRPGGAEESPTASVVSIAETHCAEGSGLSRHIDLGAAVVAIPEATGRTSSPPRFAKTTQGPILRYYHMIGVKLANL